MAPQGLGPAAEKFDNGGPLRYTAQHKFSRMGDRGMKPETGILLFVGGMMMCMGMMMRMCTMDAVR